jgi:zinc D-Ala-D-Ala carboxypeptidase
VKICSVRVGASSVGAMVVAVMLGATLLVAPVRAVETLSAMAGRLLADPSSVARDSDGRAALVFGVAAREARMVLLPVTRERALPPGYEPPDLTSSVGRPVRALIVPDFEAMRSAAATAGVEIAVISGYRSPGQQVSAFEGAVWRQISRSGGTIDRAEAERRAARFVAPPGHSQHQLGTAVDVSSGELGYALQPAFAETAAGRWLWENAWAYGFVFPYTAQGESLSGYGYEPWHLRWVGRPLTGLMQADGYRDHPSVVADDYLRGIEEILDAEAIPW